MTPRTIYTDPQWIDSVSLWLVNEETWVDGVCVVTVRHWIQKHPMLLAASQQVEINRNKTYDNP